jgi:hypothetical protein
MEQAKELANAQEQTMRPEVEPSLFGEGGMRSLRARVLAALVAALGCAAPDPAGPSGAECTAPGPVVAVTPDTLGLVSNGTVGSFSGQYSKNCAVRDTSWVWTVSDTLVVAPITDVDGAVTVTPRAAGTVWVKGSVGALADSSRVLVAVVPEACSPTATHLCPGDSYQAKVDAQVDGTAFTLGTGTFQFFRIVPKQGQTFTGIWGQTILDGGKQLTGFVSTGSGTWGVGGQTQQGPVASSLPCQSGFPRCQRPEQLWIDDVLKLHVAANADVGPGRWYFDYANDSIHVGDNPAGRTIWTSVTENAVAASVSGVGLKHLTVQHYAVSGQGNGTIEARGNSWIVDSVVACRNNGGGIRAENADKIKIRWGRYCNNGQYGISASDGPGDGTLDSLLVYDVEVDSNCTQGIERGFGCGAMKITESSNFIFRRGHIHHNFGNGWWVDINSVNSHLDSSLVRFNWGTGALCEISFGCVIAYNTIEDNGQQPRDAFQNGAAVLCSASEDCWIHHNTVQRNAHGINTLQQNRGGHIVADALMEYNVITSNRGTTGYKGGYEPALHHTGRNNAWGCNTHNMSGSAVFVFDNRQQTDAAWTGAGHDTPCGTINRN